MKKLFFSLLAVISISVTSAQSIEPQSTLTKEDYLAKSSHQKVGGWLLISAGSIGLMVTLAADFANSLNDGLGSIFTSGASASSSSYTLPYLLGAAAIGSGVALLIASSKNKRRAIDMSLTSFLKLEKASLMPTSGRINKSYPALAICLSLR